MDKTFEVELIRLQGDLSSYGTVCIDRKGDLVGMTIGSGSSYYTWTALASEAVTIGEQLIAAGKAEG
ncbi:hypothetical protein [Stenotrophomonas muris]|uniref:hypothetical protein n=1 Tax=Stenotrophomonas muris TaxID=2963283 RepID=UPI00383ADE04